MKHLFTLFTIALISFPLISQDEDGSSKGGSKTVDPFSFGRNRLFQGFMIGFTDVTYGTNHPGTTNPEDYFNVNMANSITWSVNPFELDVQLIGETLKFSTGLGYTAKNFSLRDNYFLYKDGDGNMTGSQEAAPNGNLNRNRFRAGYITVPLLLYFNSNEIPQRAFRIGGGIVGGLRIFEVYRVKYFENDQCIKGNFDRGWNTNFLIADLQGTIGYGPVNLNYNMSLVPLFEDGRGPEVYPYYVSISFISILDDK